MTTCESHLYIYCPFRIILRWLVACGPIERKRRAIARSIGTPGSSHIYTFFHATSNRHRLFCCSFSSISPSLSFTFPLACPGCSSRHECQQLNPWTTLAHGTFTLQMCIHRSNLIRLCASLNEQFKLLCKIWRLCVCVRVSVYECASAYSAPFAFAWKTRMYWHSAVFNTKQI